MKKVLLRLSYLLTGLLLLLTGFASAQTNQSKSPPGRLGNPKRGQDSRPPVISLSEVNGATVRAATTRSIKIVPAKGGTILLVGDIEDDWGVASLTINGQKIRLRGNLRTKKKFGLKLRSPRPGRRLKLEFVATDLVGNTARKTYEINGSTTANSQPELVLRRETKPDINFSQGDLGRYWALIVGVETYPDPEVQDLDYPVADAEDIANVLTQYYTFDPGQVKLLSNPTRAELIAAMAQYSAGGNTPLGDNDNLLLYYAGHGYWDKNYREGYWLPSDAQQSNRANWVSNSDIQNAFTAIKARHVLLLSDACFSGSLFATRQAFTVAIEEAYKEPSRKAITAGNFTEVPDISVFKQYLLLKLKENREPFLDAGTLYNSIKEPVTNNSATRQRPIYGVIQQTGDEGGEFIFVRRN